MAQAPSKAPDGAPDCPHCGGAHPPAFSHCPKTGKPLTTGKALIGREIAGRYRVVGLLGEGGMGAVYVAEHTLIKHKVAIKRLHPELASDAKAVARFQREAQAAAATGHDNIVKVIDMGFSEDGAPFLVMEYLKGRSLASTLRKEGRLAPPRACHIVGQVLAALAAVHAAHIVHRDLKPDNIFLIRRGTHRDFVKILDFGVSKMRREGEEGMDLTRTGVLLGTPFYMSPEQARGMKDLDHRVDIYAAGVILYECLTGRLPFDGQNYHALLQAILAGSPFPIRELVPEVDAGLTRVVERALARDRAMRWPDVAEMLRALTPFGARDVPSTLSDRDHDAPAAFEAVAQRRSTPTRMSDSPSARSSWDDARLSSDGDDDIDAMRARLPGPKKMRPQPGSFARQSDDWHDDARSWSGHSPTPPAHSAPRMRRVTRPSAVESLHAPVNRAGALTQAKGSLLIAALDYVEKTHGRPSLDTILEGMPPDHRARVTGIVMPVGWFPLETYAALLESAERVLGTGNGSVAEAIGAATATRELPTAHRLFMQSATPAMAVERIPLLVGSYHDHVETELSQGADGGIRVVLKELTPDTVLHSTALCGFFRQLLELAGARGVRVALLSSRGRGDERTVISLRWH